MRRLLRTPAPGDTGGADVDAPLLRLDGVTKRWNTELVLDEVALEMRAGFVTGVVGDNGAGKTTLLRIACRHRHPRARHRPVPRHRHRARPDGLTSARSGLLSAGDRGLYARLTVNQNLAFCGGLAGLSRRSRRERIGEVLSEFDLDELAQRRVERLSMGQRQRVRLAARSCTSR